jgi:hypothetical protein
MLNINKKYLYLLLFINIGLISNGWQRYISRNYVKERSIQQYGFILGQTQFYELEKDDDCRIISSFAVPIFTFMRNNNYGDSFTIDRKNTLLIAGDSTPFEKTRDIRSEWVGGDENTVVNLSLNPEQTISGLKLLFQIPFSSFIKSDALPNWAISIRTVFAYEKQRLNLLLNGLNDENFLKIRNFFENETQNAKIDGKYRSNMGFEALTFSLDGLYKSPEENLKIYYYGGIELPVSETWTSPYLFYPYLGNNGNIGSLLGCMAHGFFYNKNDYNLGILLEIENHFLFYKTMERTFDLFNKPWSRYLPAENIYQNTIGKTVASVSTLPVRMHPCNSIDGSIGLLIRKVDFLNQTLDIGIGYNLWVAQGEYSELQDRVYRSQYQNFYTYGIKGDILNTTSSNSDISKKMENDLIEIPFNINNLDIWSVCAVGGYTQTIFGRATIKGETYSLLCGLWTEIGDYTVMPSRYGFWIGLGANF